MLLVLAVLQRHCWLRGRTLFVFRRCMARLMLILLLRAPVTSCRLLVNSSNSRWKGSALCCSYAFVHCSAVSFVSDSFAFILLSFKAPCGLPQAAALPVAASLSTTALWCSADFLSSTRISTNLKMYVCSCLLGCDMRVSANGVSAWLRFEARGEEELCLCCLPWSLCAFRSNLFYL